LRIAIVASDYFPTVGGVQIAVHNIARQAHRQGHPTIIMSSLPPGNVPATEIEEGIAVYRFPWGRHPLWSLPFRAWETLWGMWRVLRQFKPDVVYVHFLAINALGVLLLHYLWRFTLVVSSRGNDVQGIPLRSRVQRWMLPHLFQRADAIVFCSEYLRRDAEPFLRHLTPDKPICVVGDGFDPDEFREPRPYQHSAPYILAMGRLVHKKGFELLIRAFAQISSEFPRFHLLIAGDGEERSKLEQWIDDLNLREHVILLGFANRAESISLFWGCEFFVLSSRLEPFGIVVAEAMAAHKAVLATRSGGVVDLIQPGVNGLLVDTAVDALAQGLRAMLAHPDATRAMGERAYQTIQRHTWLAVTKEFVEIFERVSKSR